MRLERATEQRLAGRRAASGAPEAEHYRNVHSWPKAEHSAFWLDYAATRRSQARQRLNPVGRPSALRKTHDLMSAFDPKRTFA